MTFNLELERKGIDLKGFRFKILIGIHLWFSMLFQNTIIPTPPEIDHGIIFIPLGSIIGVVVLLIFLKLWRKEENHQGKTDVFP